MKPKSLETPEFPILTTQEMETLNRAAADGKHGQNYQNSEYLASRVHQVPGASHRVQLGIESEDGFEAIEQLTAQQDADSALAMLYIVHLLAPPATEQKLVPLEGEIDFDDVISKIGWTPRGTANREELRTRIYNVLRFGERAIVVGSRSNAYKDKMTGKVKDTQIEASLWRIHKVKRPKDATRDMSSPPPVEAPFKATIVISSAWVPLLTSPEMAQYLPLGEVLGKIPGAKPSGAWARVIGLSLASFWRRNPVAAFEGTIKPTRRELLERYPPKTGRVGEILESKDPRHAIDYWCGALAILVESGFLDASGEALMTAETMRESVGRQEWSEEWLDETIEVRPGARIVDVVRDRMNALRPAKALPKTKRGKRK